MNGGRTRDRTLDLSRVKALPAPRASDGCRDKSNPPEALVPEGVGDHLLRKRGNFRRSWQPSLTLGWGGRRWKFLFAIKAPEQPVRVRKSLILLLTFAPVVPTI
jgi:hypothetical protein